MTRPTLILACATAFVVTSYITLCLVLVNVGLVEKFIWIWLRSWLIAFLLAVPSLLFVAPFIRKRLQA